MLTSNNAAVVAYMKKHILRLLVPAIKDYRAALYQFFTLAGTYLTANRVTSRNVQQLREELSSKGDQTTRMEPVSGSEEPYSSAI